MKLNLKVRMRHKTFILSLLALILSLASQIAGMFGIDITVYNDQITELAETILMILGLLGVVIDPTTSGLNDSEQAMSYEKPKED